MTIWQWLPGQMEDWYRWFILPEKWSLRINLLGKLRLLKELIKYGNILTSQNGQPRGVRRGYFLLPTWKRIKNNASCTDNYGTKEMWLFLKPLFLSKTQSSPASYKNPFPWYYRPVACTKRRLWPETQWRVPRTAAVAAFVRALILTSRRLNREAGAAW